MEALCDVYGVNGFPTILLFHRGNLVEEYHGDHQARALWFYLRDRVGRLCGVSGLLALKGVDGGGGMDG